MRNYFNKLRYKLLSQQGFFNLHTKSPYNSGSEIPSRRRNLSPTLNLDIKSLYRQ